ncbi:MAG: hypothetical protein ABI417_11125 [Coleofasciculaceae cyanobacterium]
MKALQSKNRINTLTEGNRTKLTINPEIGVNRPKDGVVIGIDLGTLDNKVAMLAEDGVIEVVKIPNFLSLATVDNAATKAKNSFANRRKKPSNSDLVVTWQGQAYALGTSGVIRGGEINLSHDKTEELQVILRILFALTQFGLGNGETIHLSIAAAFESAAKFNKLDARIRASVTDSLAWGTSDGTKSVSIKTLKIDPEDYHAELFSRFYSTEAGFEGQARGVIGVGHRTGNFGFIDSDGYYDDVRSCSFDGKGMSLFYQWIATDLGIESITKEFIEAVNHKDDFFRVQGSDEEFYLLDSVKMAKGWYTAELLKLAKKVVPSEIKNFLICGGGAIPNEVELRAGLWGKTEICPEAGIANVAGQIIELALELAQV